MVVLPRESLRSLRITPMANGKDLSTATGFLAPGNVGYHLVTNWHVLSGRNATTGEILSRSGATPDALRISHPSAKAGIGHWTDRIEPLRDDDGEAIWREHALLGSRVDVAAFALTEVDEINAEPYQVDAAQSDVFISMGERLSVIGYPFGVTSAGGFPIWTQGFVATEPELLFNDLPCFLIDARTREGQSGSPVIFYASSGMYPAGPGSTKLGNHHPATRFMGVYSGRINSESDLGVVWSPSAIDSVVRHGVASSSL